MKYYLVFFLSVVLLGCEPKDSGQISPDLVSNPATANPNASAVGQPVMEFEKTSHDFGTIVQGETVKVIYEFTNTGNKELIISSANGSCGCTIPTWPKRPIKPGQKSQIEVVFNSKGKKGKQTKKIYITANTIPSDNIVALKGEVVAPE